jgi:hypothetical protein
VFVLLGVSVENLKLRLPLATSRLMSSTLLLDLYDRGNLRCVKLCLITSSFALLIVLPNSS